MNSSPRNHTVSDDSSVCTAGTERTGRTTTTFSSLSTLSAPSQGVLLAPNNAYTLSRPVTPGGFRASTPGEQLLGSFADKDDRRAARRTRINIQMNKKIRANSKWKVLGAVPIIISRIRGVSQLRANKEDDEKEGEEAEQADDEDFSRASVVSSRTARRAIVMQALKSTTDNRRRRCSSVFGGDNADYDPFAGRQNVARGVLENSMIALDRSKWIGLEDVTSVRLEMNRDAVDRRTAFEGRRIEWEKKVAEKREEMDNVQTDVGLMLSSLSKRIGIGSAEDGTKLISSALEVKQMMEDQQEGYNSLVSSKEDLISDIRAEITTHDEEYVSNLHADSDAVDEIISRMREEYDSMREEYETKLDEIERAFDSERRELLSTNAASIKELEDRRRSILLSSVGGAISNEFERLDALNAVVIDEDESVVAEKRRVESEVHVAELRLRDLTESTALELVATTHRHSLLMERDVENAETLIRQRRRLAKLKDDLFRAVRQYHDAQVKEGRCIEDISEGVRRAEVQLLNLKAKARSFRGAEVRKYEEIYDMHQEEVMDLVYRLMEAGRVISEDILGWEWRPPSWVESRSTQQIVIPVVDNNENDLNKLNSLAPDSISKHKKRYDNSFWKKASMVISKDNFDIWKELEIRMTKCHNLLKRSLRTKESIQNLQNENSSLKQTLHKYMESPINDDLFIPPTRFMLDMQQSAQSNDEA